MPGLGQQAGQDQILVSPGVWKSSLFPNPCSWNRQHHPKPPPLPWHAARGLTVPPPPALSRQERGSAGLSGSAEEVQGRGAAVNNRKGRAVTRRGPASPASCGQQQLPREALPARGPAEPGLEGSWCHARSTPGLGKSGTSAVKDRGTEPFGTPTPSLLLESAQHGLEAKLGDGRTSPRGWDQDKSWAAATASGQMPRIYTFSKGKPILGYLLTLQISSLHKPGSAAGAGSVPCSVQGFGRARREGAPWADPQLCPLPGW